MACGYSLNDDGLKNSVASRNTNNECLNNGSVSVGGSVSVSYEQDEDEVIPENHDYLHSIENTID